MSFRSVVSSTEDGRGLEMPWRTRGLRLSDRQNGHVGFQGFTKVNVRLTETILFQGFTRHIVKDKTIWMGKPRIIYQIDQFIDNYITIFPVYIK